LASSWIWLIGFPIWLSWKWFLFMHDTLDFLTELCNVSLDIIINITSELMGH
jgi:hypothetical protein